MALPRAVDPDLVGTYPALAGAGGGMVWDEVLEYRAWVHDPEGDDYFYPCATYDEARELATRHGEGCEVVALVLQREYLEEAEPDHWVHVREERRAEWPVELLSRPRRDDRTIPDFLADDSPHDRLAVIRGQAPRPGRSGETRTPRGTDVP